ncbi:MULTISPECIES: branched-chain amino acid ABC transporter permease [unclassified Xanthobacter]|uniref:branched-chain amino acid ABC transporter permease n=1 Tax=unclassified Xanthobacter TaxID=2623496 RepID=UPI001EDF69CC|nr:MULTISPECIES: branched-chain amino acid ABC transporter permease [unclassified Xanthobacter]
MTVSLLVEQLVNGIITGSMYALMGAGLALVYGTMRVMNFSHGEFFMVAAYILFLALGALMLPTIPAALLAILGAACLGGLIEKGLIEPLMKREGWELGTIVTTLGLSFILQNGVLQVIGEEYYTLQYFVDGSITLFGVTLPYQRLLILAVAIGTIALMELFLRRSRAGWALRAVSQDAQAASVVGINVGRVFLMAFALSGALSGVAAVMMAPIQSVNPWMGVPMGLKAFVVVVLGGMGSFRGTIIAGFIVGIVEALGTTVTSSEWRELFSFGLLILIIWFKPEGLFGNVGRRA